MEISLVDKTYFSQYCYMDHMESIEFTGSNKRSADMEAEFPVDLKHKGTQLPVCHHHTIAQNIRHPVSANHTIKFQTHKE